MKLFPDFGVAIDEKYSGIRNCGLVPDGKTSQGSRIAISSEFKTISATPFS
jgi:hypothetical protein